MTIMKKNQDERTNKLLKSGLDFFNFKGNIVITLGLKKWKVQWASNPKLTNLFSFEGNQVISLYQNMEKNQATPN